MKSVELKWIETTYSDEDINSIEDGDGIYLICEPDAYSDYEIMYVGQGEIKNRLIKHNSDKPDNEDLADYIFDSQDFIIVYYAYCRKIEINGIEKYIYEWYSPKFNKKSPPGDEMIKVNLP